MAYHSGICRIFVTFWAFWNLPLTIHTWISYWSLFLCPLSEVLVRTQGFLLSASGAQMGPQSNFGQASHLTKLGGMRVHDLKLSSAHGIISTRISISGGTKMEKVYHLFQ